MAQVTTIHGLMEEELLEKRVSVEETVDGTVDATEYWYQGELVHRSVHLTLKQGVDIFGQAAVLA